VISAIVRQIPEIWLEAIQSGESAEQRRGAYVDFLARRLAAAQIFEEEAMKAHARLI
jgi:hypothetical protein